MPLGREDSAGRSLPAEMKRPAKHVEAPEEGRSDRGSTPLASTSLIFKDLELRKKQSKTQSKTTKKTGWMETGAAEIGRGFPGLGGAHRGPPFHASAPVLDAVEVCCPPANVCMILHAKDD